MQLNRNVTDEVINSWYGQATVRYTPRIMVPDYAGDELIYPVERSVVAGHPLVEAKGKSVVSYVLTQSAYQFLFGVGLLETKFVIQCSLNLLHGRIGEPSDLEKLQALTVVVDEAYHAQVALDYIIQMKSKSGIDPLVVPETNRKLDATQRVYDALPPELHMDFQLLAVTLAESVLTNEIANLGRENGLAKTFITVMTDHVKDEGRHSKYFAKLMTSRWAQLSPDVQLRFGAMLPDYLDDFLAMDMGRPMDRKVLKACGLDGQEIEKVISDTRQRVEADHEEQSYRTKVRLFKLLRQIGVLDHQQNRLAFTTRTYAA